jgi:hypothetical protein
MKAMVKYNKLREAADREIPPHLNPLLPWRRGGNAFSPMRERDY